MLRSFALYCFILCFSSSVYTQVVNGYAKVTNVTGATLTLSNVDETADSFEDGEWVVLMQMQDDVIGTTTNTAGFGDLGSINSAGLHEIRRISSHTESLGVPTSITLENVPNFTYNTCTNCSVQIISFRIFGSPDYTTTADMSALPWDGDIGGVLAFVVGGTLTLNHNLSADSDGFRGAGTNGGGSTGCTGSSNYRVTTGVNHADKGEGIYKATDLNYAAGRARILTGGGGGNSHNAGGGGGGNYTGGGLGGPGWPTCTPTAGGIGGLDMSATIAVGRIFLGGGGGAGEGNNGFATDGQDGGGIILVRAEEIETDACAGVSITANGGSVPGTGGNDGGGGGGAGGSIIFEVDTWSISGPCPLTISANGGDGGDVSSGATHGGGGGGGQGVVIFSITEPTTNVTTETNNGVGGCNNNSVPCNSLASTGTGTDGSGILDILTGPLPIELLHFSGEVVNDDVLLQWTTKSERNNAFFTIERSKDNINWEEIAKVDGAGNSTSTLDYSAWDYHPLPGISYYRLKQTDFNGEFNYSAVISIVLSTETTLVYPNPSNELIYLSGEHIDPNEIQLVDALGRLVFIQPETLDFGLYTFPVRDLPNGVYILTLKRGVESESHRITVLH